MIESLQSPHTVRVKALLSSKKERLENKLFVVEGLQGLREALLHANQVETLYLSKSGIERLEKAGINYSNVNMVEISEKVAEAMSDAITSQGIIAICNQFGQIAFSCIRHDGWNGDFVHGANASGHTLAKVAFAA